MFILLDIDGVMVPAKNWQTIDSLEDGFVGFSPMAVSCLNKLTRETKATIVLTTSHRNRFSKKDWIRIFRNRGIYTTRIDQLITRIENNRLDEILDWFSYSNVSPEEVIIIDDDKRLNDLPYPLKHRLVLTKSLVGFDNQALEDALRFVHVPSY